MAQDFYPVFDEDDLALATMPKIVDDNTSALRTKFSGTSEPLEKLQFQWWADTTANKIKLRDSTNTTWEDIIDITDYSVILQSDQVKAVHIDSTETKPTLVQGVNIAPLSCEIKTPSTGCALPVYPYELFSLPSGFGSLGTTGWQTLITTRIYIPSAAGAIKKPSNLYITARLTTCSMRFILGGSTSTVVGPEAGPTWSSEAVLSLTALSGWLDLEVQGLSTQGSPPYGGITGISSRFNEG